LKSVEHNFTITQPPDYRQVLDNDFGSKLEHFHTRMMKNGWPATKAMQWEVTAFNTKHLQYVVRPRGQQATLFVRLSISRGAGMQSST